MDCGKLLAGSRFHGQFAKLGDRWNFTGRGEFFRKTHSENRYSALKNADPGIVWNNHQHGHGLDYRHLLFGVGDHRYSAAFLDNPCRLGFKHYPRLILYETS